MSVLDARIRRLAREELERTTATGPVAAAGPDSDRLASLEKEVAELRGDLKRAYARIDALSPAGPEEKSPARRTRKTAE